MGQTAASSLNPTLQMQICCQPAVSQDSSPVTVARMEESLPTLLSTPTAGAQNGDEKKAFQPATKGEASFPAVIDPDATIALLEVNAQVSDADGINAEIDAADGPNRATGPSPTE